MSSVWQLEQLGEVGRGHQEVAVRDRRDFRMYWQLLFTSGFESNGHCLGLVLKNRENSSDTCCDMKRKTNQKMLLWKHISLSQDLFIWMKHGSSSRLRCETFWGTPFSRGKKPPHCEEPLVESCCYLLRCSQSIPHLSLVQNRRSLSVSPWWDLILNVWRTSKFAVFTTPSVEVLGIFEMMNKFAPRLAHWKPQQADTLLTIITALWNSEYKENKVLLGVKSYSSDVWDLLNHQIHCLSSANLFSVAYSPMHSSA